MSSATARAFMPSACAVEFGRHANRYFGREDSTPPVQTVPVPTECSAKTEYYSLRAPSTPEWRALRALGRAPAVSIAAKATIDHLVEHELKERWSAMSAASIVFDNRSTQAGDWIFKMQACNLQHYTLQRPTDAPHIAH